MTVTDLTVTGFVPMFATLHSALFNADPIPVEITAAFAVLPRMIPARTVHTFLTICLPPGRGESRTTAPGVKKQSELPRGVWGWGDRRRRSRCTPEHHDGSAYWNAGRSDAPACSTRWNHCHSLSGQQTKTRPTRWSAADARSDPYGTGGAGASGCERNIA